MEQTLLDAFKIAPALVALVVVVYLFMKAQQWMIKQSETAAQARNILFVEAVKDIHKEHIEQRVRSLTVMEQMSVVNKELAQTLGSVKEALHECAETHRRAGQR